MSHSFQSSRRVGFGLGEEPEPYQRIVQFVGIGRIGPRLLTHARYRRLIETADLVGGIRIEPASAHHGLRAALFERRIVEIGIRSGGQHLARERRGLGQVARDDPDLRRTRYPPSRRSSPSISIASFRQSRNGLRDERMIRHFALADEILGAGHLVREDRADQILGHHAHELRRHLLAAAETWQRERDACHPAPARAEHRRIEQRLDEQFAHGLALR